MKSSWCALVVCAGVLVAAPALAPPPAGEGFDRVIVLGFDGMDAGLVSQWMTAGRLPNLAALADLDGEGRFRRLTPTTPPESPVSWAAMVTGLNPGKTGIFGFVRRDPADYRLENGLVDIRPGLHLTRNIPLTPTRLSNRRQGEAFWETAADSGIPSVAITVPVSFPSRQRDNLRELPGLGVGDLFGTQGTFQFFTTRAGEVPDGGESLFGGRVRRLVSDAGGDMHMMLDGPAIPRRNAARHEAGEPPRLPMRLSVVGDGRAVVEIEQAGASALRFELAAGEWSELTRVEFRIAGVIRVRGVVRLLLLRASNAGDRPDAALYVSPIYIDPLAPVVALTRPKGWSATLSERHGLFKTSGISTEVWARGEDYIGDAAYLADVEDTHAAWERLVLDELGRPDWRLFVAVSQATDHIGHLFANRDQEVVLRFYQRVDRLVGQVMREQSVGRNTLLLVVSDHGMAEFGRAVNLNRWLQQAGLLALEEGRDEVRREIGDFYAHRLTASGIDWNRTKAYAAGLGGIFVNLRGREGRGVVSPGEECNRVLEEIREGLTRLRDPASGRPVVEEVYDGRRIYSGARQAEAPDLVVGMARGFRVSWETALAGVAGPVVEDNAHTWAADHCSVDRRLVPGVLFANHRLEAGEAIVEDLAPTVLDALGVAPSQPTDGSSLLAWSDSPAGVAGGAIIGSIRSTPAPVAGAR